MHSKAKKSAALCGAGSTQEQAGIASSDTTITAVLVSTLIIIIMLLLYTIIRKPYDFVYFVGTRLVMQSHQSMACPGLSTEGCWAHI